MGRDASTCAAQPPRTPLHAFWVILIAAVGVVLTSSVAVLAEDGHSIVIRGVGGESETVNAGEVIWYTPSGRITMYRLTGSQKITIPEWSGYLEVFPRSTAGKWGPVRLPLDGAPQSHLRCVFPQGRRIRIRLRSPSGGPGSGISVALRPADWPVFRAYSRPGSVYHRKQVTNDLGVAEFSRLWSSPYRIQLQAPLGMIVPPIDPVIARPIDTEVVVQLVAKAHPPVSVRVLGNDGRPVEAALVIIGTRGTSSAQRVRTDTRGVAVLAGLDPNVVHSVTILPRAPTRWRSYSSEWVPREATIKLARDHPIRGRLRRSGPADAARPFAGREPPAVWLKVSEFGRRRAEVDPSGRFEFNDLGVGLGHLVIEGQREISLVAEHGCRSIVALDSARVPPLRVVISGRAEGRIGAVLLAPVGGSESGAWAFQGMVSGDGDSATFVGALPAVEYLMYVQTKDGRRAGFVRGRPRELKQAHVLLKPVRTIIADLTTASGVTVEAVLVKLDAAPLTFSGVRQPSGDYSITAGPPELPCTLVVRVIGVSGVRRTIRVPVARGRDAYTVTVGE